VMEPDAPRLTKAMFTRDPVLCLPSGAIVGRMAALMRRGEERSVTGELARLGVPILHTIAGAALVEGGSFAKLRHGLAAYGTSIRCNRAGADQLRDVLRWHGIELIVVPLAGFSIHLDGHFAMVDVDKALVNPPGLPHWFLDRLGELGIETIFCDPSERWAVNALTLDPGRLVMSAECERTADKLRRRGVEVIPVPYDEVEKNGGGVHCSTVELHREPAA
jgi:N-dimethylarginine dimethylaminohydrolase